MLEAGKSMSEDKKDTKPLSRGKRFVKLAAMTASVAGNYTRSRIKGVFQSEDGPLGGISQVVLVQSSSIQFTLI